MAYLALGNKGSEEREETGAKGDSAWLCDTEIGRRASHGTAWADLTTLCLGKGEEEESHTQRVRHGMAYEAVCVASNGYRPARDVLRTMQ